MTDRSIVGNKKLHLVLDSRLDELDRLAEAIEGFCAQVGVSDRGPDFALCAEELVTNVIVHGFAGEAGNSIGVEIGADGGRITVTITDTAPAFDPTVPISPDLNASVEDRAIGGLGRHLVSTLMDSFCYRRVQGHNEVSFGQAAVK